MLGMNKSGKKSWVRVLFLAIGLVLMRAVFPAEAEEPAKPGSDSTVYRVSLWSGHEFRTARIQALRGDWKLTLHPAPPASSAEALFSQETIVEIPEGEHVILELVPTGIIAQTSKRQTFEAGYLKAELTGGDFLNVEVPMQSPMIFRGKWEVAQKEKSLTFQNVISLRDYLVSLTSENCPSFEPEAIKAYIVAVRTLILAEARQPPHASESYHLCDTSHCLNFRGAGGDRDLIKFLVDSVDNEVLQSKGNIFSPHLTHTCGGKISSAREIFSQPDDIHLMHEDRQNPKAAENCFHSPSFTWVREFKKEEILEFFALTYAAGVPEVFVRWEPTKIDSCGRITEVKLFGRREKVIEGREFLRHLTEHFGPISFRSMKFSVQSMRQTSIFRGYGQGFGVGMCIMGADGLAKKGWSYRQILEFYYSGVNVVDPGNQSAPPPPPPTLPTIKRPPSPSPVPDKSSSDPKKKKP